MGHYAYELRLKELVALKNYLDVLITPINEPFVAYLKSLNENDTTSLTGICENLNLKRDKAAKLIKELYAACIESFSSEQKLVVSSQTVTIVIRDQARDKSPSPRSKKDKAMVQYKNERVLAFQLSVPTLPRLGEHIMFEFIDPQFRYVHGTVLDIYHTFSPTEQIVTLYAEVSENLYFQLRKWKELTERADQIASRYGI